MQASFGDTTNTTTAKEEASEHAGITKISAISLTTASLLATFSYFFHIDYFPLFDLEAASSYLIAFIWVTVVLLLFLGALLLMPYYIMAMALTSGTTAKSEKKQTAYIIQWMGFGVLSMICLSAGVMLAARFNVDINYGLIGGAVLILALYCVFIYFFIRDIKRKCHGTRLILVESKLYKMLFGLLGIATLSAAIQLAPLWVLILIFDSASSIKGDDYLTFIFICGAAAMASAVVAGIALLAAFVPRYRKMWRIALALILTLPLFLLIISQATGMLPMSVAHLTKIGNFRAEKIILAPKACGNIAPILGIECDEKTSPPIQLCNVHIMSRVGPETYLRIAGQTANKDGKFPVHRVLLASADISAMQVDFSIKNLRLKDIDTKLADSGSDCGTTLTTLHGDTAFDFKGFTLTDSGKAQLLTFIQEIKRGERVIEKVTVTGHADQIGDAKYNAWLAKRRADEVKLFLDKHMKNLTSTIPVESSEKGSTQPLIKACGILSALKERIQCEAPNRRVELEIIRKAQPAKKG